MVATQEREFMSRDVLTLNPDAGVRDAVMLMATHGVGSVVLVGEDGPVGVFTERDLLRTLGKGPIKKGDTLEVLGSSKFGEMDWSVKAHEAARRMTEAKGRLLVFDEDRLVGIVTTTDIVNVIWRTGVDFELGDVVSREVVMLKASCTMMEVLKKMDQENVGCVILTRGKSPCAIFTERDLLSRLLYLNQGLVPGKEQFLRSGLGEPVSSVATTPIVTAKLGTTGAEAARTMVARRIKRLPLVQKGKIVGIVTARDLVEAYAFPSWTSGSGWGEHPKAKYGEVCPICGTRIDPEGLCACGAGGD